MGDSEVEDVDLLVVGGGKAGKSLAMDRAKAGWSVVMVERDKIGALPGLFTPAAYVMPAPVPGSWRKQRPR
jgi:flavin-dependent dehydrogenase